MGASAALALWIFGVLGIFPDGEQLRALLRRLLRADGVHPVRRPDHRAAAGRPRGAVHQTDHGGVGARSLFIALQQLEGHVVAPQVFRISLRINPILIILALLIGYQLYGIVGCAGRAAGGRGDPPDRLYLRATWCSSRGERAAPPVRGPRLGA